MTNNYESLLDERFQMLCQSLLTMEYPGVQCMPVGMPDGGRDAIVVGKPGHGAIVYQVKYARNPASVPDRAQWVIDAIKPELPKIDILVQQKAANRYVLMTNMPGTSHLKSGSIDKVQRYIDDHLPIQGQCLWRDDLDRRIDPHIELKLKYPGLISGEDALALLWHLMAPGEDQSRRESALDAYLAHQYDQDQRVRFKEVGLSSNSLFDLYIDVPASMESRRPEARSKHVQKYFNALAQAAAVKLDHLDAGSDDQSEANYSATSPTAPTETDIDVAEVEEEIEMVLFPAAEEMESLINQAELLENYTLTVSRAGEVGIRTAKGYHEVLVGAAELILGSNFMDENPCVVLEGAPGQGKSTLSQYLMQVQRARLLLKTDATAKLPDYCAYYPVMLPIKLELRDVALWLKGIDPWAIEQGKRHEKIETFEAALAGHIERYSGGVRSTKIGRLWLEVRSRAAFKSPMRPTWCLLLQVGCLRKVGWQPKNWCRGLCCATMLAAWVNRAYCVDRGVTGACSEATWRVSSSSRVGTCQQISWSQHIVCWIRLAQSLSRFLT